MNIVSPVCIYSQEVPIYVSSIFMTLCLGRASLVTQLVKNPPEMWETWDQSLSWEDPL